MDQNQTSPIVPVQSSVQPSVAPAASAPELPSHPEKLLPAQASLPTQHHTSWGAVLGIIIIILVLTVGALYFWGAKLAERDAAGLTPKAPSGTSGIPGFDADAEATP